MVVCENAINFVTVFDVIQVYFTQFMSTLRTSKYDRTYPQIKHI